MRFALAAMLALAATACHKDRAGTTTTTGGEIALEPVATDQNSDARDVALVAQIRRDLVTDDMLTMRAKNATLIVSDGVVTVRGDVASQADHDRLVARVVSVPGVRRIEDRVRIDNDEK